MTQQQRERSAQMLAEIEDGCSVTAGSLDVEAFYRKVEDTKAQATHGREPLLSVFSRVINMARRDHGWSIEQLADKADVDAIEVFRIEEDLVEAPEPRVVSSLSRALRLPAGKMMQLVGHITVLDPKVSGAAMKFAASSGSMEKLTRTEKGALNDFVKALAEE